MAKRLIDIREITSIEQSPGYCLTSCQVIDYHVNPKGEGGVGSVHSIISIDDKATENLALKIVAQEHVMEGAYQSIKLLLDKINKDSSLNGMPMFLEYPELIGHPFLIFRATDSQTGEEVVGMLMHDLHAHGYEDFGGDEWVTQDYLNHTSLEDRIFLAYQYARAIAYLHHLNFIHCDLKEQSVFINKSRPSLTLIDFDGGFNHDKQLAGLTIGAITSWMSAFIKKALKIGISAKDINPKERLQEELFYIASGIYNIIFGVSPYFFLNDGEEETILEYLKNNQWPSIENTEKIINKKNKQAHAYCVNLLDILKAEGYERLVEALTISFNKGYKDEKIRISAREWDSILQEVANKTIGKPQVDEFRSDKTIIKYKNEPVQLSWNGKYFKHVTIAGNRYSILDRNAVIKPKDDTKIELQLHGYFGSDSELLEIKAKKIDPIICSFRSSVARRVTLEPVILSWDVDHCEKVRISSHYEDLPAKGTIEVDPKEKTVFTLSAFGNFDQEVSSQLEIDVLLPSINEFRYEINIEPGIDNVDLHWHTQDALSVEIIPRPGNVPANGKVQVGIPDRTVFTITAHGHFGVVSKTIEAAPFPLPIIKTLLIPTPEFNIETQLNTTKLQIPNESLRMPVFVFDGSILINPSPNFTDLSLKQKEIMKDIPVPILDDKILNHLISRKK
jgi:hypothetical protein